MISPLWIILVALEKRKKEKTTENGQLNAFFECEGDNYSATCIYCISSFEHQGIFHRRKVYLELNSTYVTRRKNKVVRSNVTFRSCFSLKKVTRQSLLVTNTAFLLFYS